MGPTRAVGRCTCFSVSGAYLFNTKQTKQCHWECVLFLGTRVCAPGMAQGLLSVPPATSPPVSPSLAPGAAVGM